MGELNGCISKLKLTKEDAEEIRRHAREAGGPLAGVKAYKDSLMTDVESLRATLSDKGYDFSVKKPQQELGDRVKPPEVEADASMADLGYDVQNVADTAQYIKDNINLIRGLVDTVPGLSADKNLFKWIGTNRERLSNFSSKYFNVADPDDFDVNMRVVQETFPDLFDKSTRGVVSDAQTAKEAKALGAGRSLDENAQALINTPAGYAPNAAEVQFGKMVIGAMHDRMRQLARTDVSKLTPEQREATTKALEDAQNSLVNATIRVAGMSSESGRSLRAWRVTPEDNDLGGIAKASIKLTKFVTGNTDDELERRARLGDILAAINQIDPGDREMLDSFVANMHNARGNLSDMFYEVYYNWGLLSNPSTQVINAFGNVITATLDNAERAIAAGSMAISDPAEFRRVASRAVGYWDAIPEAWQAAKSAYLTELPRDPNTRMENMGGYAIPSWRAMWNEGDWLPTFKRAGVGEKGVVVGGKQVRVWGRFLMGVDDGMKLLHQRAYIKEAAVRDADAKGIVGQSARDAHYAEYLKNIPREVQEAALQESRRLTYTDQMSQAMRGFQHFMDVLPGGRIIVPFIRTPAKIMLQAADMLLPITSRTAADLKAGGLAKRRAQTRLLMGWSLLGTGAWAAANGYATGAAPSDPGERATFELSKLPWAAKFDNTWIQYNRLDPVAIPLSFGAGLAETVKAFAAGDNGVAREENYMAMMAGLLSDALLDKTFFQGIENVVGALMDPERSMDGFAKGVVRSFVPAVAAGYARATDPRVTAPMTFMEVIQDRIGFEQRTKVPTKVDGFGRDVWVEVPGTSKGDDTFLSGVNRMLNPFKTKSGANDPLANELYDLGVSLPGTRKKYKDVALNSEQVYILNKATGKQFRAFVDTAVNSPEWAKIPTGIKRRLIDKFKSVSNEYGNQMLLATYPELLKRGIMESGKVRKLTAPTRSETDQYLKFGGKKAVDESKK